ncbi:hypothetical protein BDR06DRAFT_1006832 [Suillus hirtellus]|nr:hypothetical protein BDR06DRAFT_1006832 [Suillus hirtellus]
MLRALASLLCGGRDQGQTRGPPKKLYATAPPKANKDKPPSNIRKPTANPSRPPPDPKRYPNQQNLVAPRT